MKGCAMVLLLVISTVLADVPSQISFQGVLKNSEGQPVEDDVYAIKFRIYDAETEGVILWESEGFIPIQTADGLFQHILGSTRPIPDSISRYTDLWVGITVDLDEELAPRTKLVSVPYSLSAQYSDTTSTSLDKTINASELTEGILDVGRYSAYGDLVSEEKIGEGSDQVAAGNHVHPGVSGAMMRHEDTELVTVQINSSNVEIFIKSITVPSDVIGNYFRVSYAARYSGPANIYVRTRANDELISNVNIGTTPPGIISSECFKFSNSLWASGEGMIDILPEEELTIDIYAFYGYAGSASVTVGNLIVEYDVD
jgi:hypothetical protein